MCVQYLNSPEEGIRILSVRGAGGCKLPTVGAGDTTQVLCKNSLCL